MITKFDDYVTLTYNSSKQLTSKYGDGFRYNYTWTNGKLAKEVYTNNNSGSESTTEFTYGNQTCKGFFPLLTEYTLEYAILLVHPELAGIRTSYLPTQIEEIDSYGDRKETDIKKFSYTFDDEGYIKTCTQNHS